MDSNPLTTEETNMKEEVLPKKVWTPELMSIVFTQFLDGLCVFSLFPILPDYVEHKLNGSASAYGYILAGMCGAGMLGQTYLGDLSDRIGRKKVMVSCLFVVSILMTLQSFVQSIGSLFVVRCFVGFFSNTDSVMNAYVTDHAPVHARDRVFAACSQTRTVAVSFGFLFGAWTYELGPKLGVDGMVLLCVMLSATALLEATAGIYLWAPDNIKRKFVSEPGKGNTPKTSGDGGTHKPSFIFALKELFIRKCAPLRNLGIRFVLSYYCAWWLALGMNTTMPFFFFTQASSYRLCVLDYSRYISTMCMFAFLWAFYAGPINEYFGGRAVLIANGVIKTVFWLIILLFPGHAILPFLEGSIDSLLQNASMAGSLAMLAKVAPPEQIGLSMGYMTLLPTFANAFTPLLGGYLVTLDWKYPVVFSITFWFLTALLPLLMPTELFLKVETPSTEKSDEKPAVNSEDTVL